MKPCDPLWQMKSDLKGHRDFNCQWDSLNTLFFLWKPVSRWSLHLPRSLSDHKEQRPFLFCLRNKCLLWQAHWHLVFVSILFILLILFSCIYFIFVFLRAALVAYGSFQTRCWIGAAAASLHHSHSNTGSEPIWGLHHSLCQRQILNPLIELRDWTWILRDIMLGS